MAANDRSLAQARACAVGRERQLAPSRYLFGRQDHMSEIELDRVAIDRALPHIRKGLQKYLWLQAELHSRNVSRDREFQRRFNGFYRVRRNSDWQRAFFGILERGKTRPVSLEKFSAHSTPRPEESRHRLPVNSLQPLTPRSR